MYGFNLHVTYEISHEVRKFMWYPRFRRKRQLSKVSARPATISALVVSSSGAGRLMSFRWRFVSPLSAGDTCRRFVWGRGAGILFLRYAGKFGKIVGTALGANVGLPLGILTSAPL